MPKILVVEDETDVNNLIKSQFEREGYQVSQAFDGPSALQQVERHQPDLVILDWMLPGMDGLSVCREIRRTHLMPIIMLTARGEEIDRVVGLEVGADDYVVKPFGVRELLARVRALLRRVALDTNDSGPSPAAGAEPAGGMGPTSLAAGGPAEGILSHGPLRIDLTGRTVYIDGEPVDLTRREFDLLALFVSNPGRAFSRAYLVERLWSDEFEVFDRAVDSHILRLRKKLGSVGGQIVTVWGIGYRFQT
jgi:DNA-binding response OmpR family regulator